ncbi:MAG: hypothetical protein ACRDZN_10445 [Acidimicrobiales bacterium]
MSERRPRRRRATFLAAAKADVGRLARDDPRLAKLALKTGRDLESRTVNGAPLEEMATTGDLTDCRKVYFGLGNPPSHRIVYRDLGASKGVEILEVVAIEQRDDLYAYLLASARLGRLPVESRRRSIGFTSG